jgi:hypothetical protein
MKVFFGNLAFEIKDKVLNQKQKKSNYAPYNIIFIEISVALIISVLILIIDSNGDGLLNMSSSQREAWDQQREYVHTKLLCSWQNTYFFLISVSKLSLRGRNCWLLGPWTTFPRRIYSSAPIST